MQMRNRCENRYSLLTGAAVGSSETRYIIAVNIVESRCVLLQRIGHKTARRQLSRARRDKSAVGGPNGTHLGRRREQPATLPGDDS